MKKARKSCLKFFVFWYIHHQLLQSTAYHHSYFYISPHPPCFWGFPCGSADKESPCNVGDLSSIPGLGRSPGEGKGYPLQYSGLENSMVLSMGLQRIRHDWVTFTFTMLFLLFCFVVCVGCFFFFFLPHQGACRILVPWFSDQGWKRCSLHWNCRVLTNRPLGTFLIFICWDI